MTDDIQPDPDPEPTTVDPVPTPASEPDITDDGAVPGEDDPAVADEPPTGDNQ